MQKYFLQDYKQFENLIIHTRQAFEARSLQLKGPAVIPTLFRNHPERHEFIRKRDRKVRLKKRKAKNAPPQIRVIFTFPEEVFRNIVINLNSRIFVKPNLVAKMVCLRRLVGAEEAIEETVMRSPYFYSSDMERVKRSVFSDPDEKNWSVSLPSKCINYYQFVADFSIIYPENKVSTVIVSCNDCGMFVETVLCECTIEMIKKDIWHNICHMNFKGEDNKPYQSTLRMATRSGTVDHLAFTEGALAIAPLSSADPLKPSLFVRCRLMLFTSMRAPIKRTIHNTEPEEGIHPTHAETMAKFGIL